MKDDTKYIGSVGTLVGKGYFRRALPNHVLQLLTSDHPAALATLGVLNKLEAELAAERRWRARVQARRQTVGATGDTECLELLQAIDEPVE